MKVLLSVMYYEPAWAYGGPPRMAYDLARHLVRRSHEVTVCTTDALDAGRRVSALEEVSQGVRVVRFRNWSNRLAYRLKILLPRGMKRWLGEHVRGFDVVHLFEARTMQNAWAAEAAARHGVPFVFSVWGSQPRGGGWRGLVKWRYDRKYGPVLLGKAAALLAQNDHERRVYEEYGAPPGRIAVWPLAVGPEEFADLPPRGAFRRRFPVADDEPVVLFVGRIAPLKGLDPLLRAAAAARRRVPRLRLVVVGRDDGFLRRLEALAAELGLRDRLLLPGPLYGKDVLPAYVDCDLFAITPTHFEETSLASLAACACGRPVLLNDRCGVPWLEEYDAGRCVPHSVENVAGALAEMLADPGLLRRTGANARRMIEERFLCARVAEQAEEIYLRAVRGPAVVAANEVPPR